ncbi:hypothetical protein [Flavobacterium granuli]|uniref:Uncharacterized protein n=1 Tax=Flavobacterium granuli TaxID=280093 RepID=A0ABU1RZQ2_9FLAO|nr:hypothetical protein [Flavobacterium granuli]MDR6844252.1 hypothetical protein [Flavobacterium granuli]
MKLKLTIVLLLFSVITYSQTKNKEVINLFDSIKSIDPYGELYSQIDRLEEEKNQIYQKGLILKQKNKVLKEFYLRQDIYRKVFDKLELGITPNQSEFAYDSYNVPGDEGNWLMVDWQLFEFTNSTDKYPTIVYYQPATDYEANGLLSSGGYPFKDFGLAFFEGDTILKKRYPYVHSMIKKGKIIFKPQSFIFPLITMAQAPKLKFPTHLFAHTNKSTVSKEKLAHDLLSWLTYIVEPAIRNSNLKGDIVADYLKMEDEKLVNPTIDDKIQSRIKFIEYLKKNYQSLWN